MGLCGPNLGFWCTSHSQPVPRRGVWTSVDVRVRMCKESRAKHYQTSCYSRPQFLWDPLSSIFMPDRGKHRNTTVSFHNLKLSVSNPTKRICCLCVRTVSNFKLPGSRPQKKHEILKTDRKLYNLWCGAKQTLHPKSNRLAQINSLRTFQPRASL